MPEIAEADISWRSHWLQQALARDRDLAPPLEEATTADVCIVGGGYLGLWTAIRLKDERPGLDIVLVEQDICGGGPSGRNSGMLLPAWAKFAGLSALGGDIEALALVSAAQAVIDEIAAFCAANAIDCWFDRVGWLWAATCEAQLGAWDDAIRRLEKLDRAPARPVGRDEIHAMTGSSAMIAGVFDPSAATVQPAFLARGLRQAALARGVRIYEKTPMRRFSRSHPLRVETARGSIEAGRLVLAMNAWSAGIPELAPAIFNIASDDAVSAPMPEELAIAGYSHGPLVIDSRVFVSGFRATRDGRLNVGVTGGHIGFGGRVDGRFHRPSSRVAEMRRALRAAHPALADFPCANAWCGPIDRTASGLPLFGRLPENPDIVYGYGFSGNGIGMTCLGSRIVASLVLDRADTWASSVLVRPVTRGFPPEPFRFIGAHFVRNAVRRRDRLEHDGRRPDPVTAWFAGLAPSGVTPSRANIATKRPGELR